VIDAWVRVSLVGIDLLTIEARVIVASIESYLHHAESFAELARHPPHQPRNLTVRERVLLVDESRIFVSRLGPATGNPKVAF
jgi:hypothetical protein